MILLRDIQVINMRQLNTLISSCMRCLSATTKNHLAKEFLRFHLLRVVSQILFVHLNVVHASHTCNLMFDWVFLCCILFRSFLVCLLKLYYWNDSSLVLSFVVLYRSHILSGPKSGPSITALLIASEYLPRRLNRHDLYLPIPGHHHLSLHAYLLCLPLLWIHT